MQISITISNRQFVVFGITMLFQSLRQNLSAHAQTPPKQHPCPLLVTSYCFIFSTEIPSSWDYLLKPVNFFTFLLLVFYYQSKSYLRAGTLFFSLFKSWYLEQHRPGNKADALLPASLTSRYVQIATSPRENTCAWLQAIPSHQCPIVYFTSCLVMNV